MKPLRDDNPALAYHTLVAALEQPARDDPVERMRWAVVSAVEGYRPLAHYRAAATARRAEGWDEADAAAAVRDWLRTDLHPLAQSCRMGLARRRPLALFRRCDESVPLGTRARLRDAVYDTSHDPLCTAAAQALIHWADEGPHTAMPLSCSAVAQKLGVQRMAAAQVLGLLESEGDMGLGQLAWWLAVSPRTLQRQLMSEGLTVTALRAACRQWRELQAPPAQAEQAEGADAAEHGQNKSHPQVA